MTSSDVLMINQWKALVSMGNVGFQCSNNVIRRQLHFSVTWLNQQRASKKIKWFSKRAVVSSSTDVRNNKLLNMKPTSLLLLKHFDFHKYQQPNNTKWNVIFTEPVAGGLTKLFLRLIEIVQLF